MKSINSTILRSLFMPLFFSTTVASAVLAIVGLFRRGQSSGTAMVAAGLIYVVGMFACTVFLNVPLNNALGSVASESGASIWSRYLKEWTMWNHVRTVSSAVACALYIWAIAAK